MINHFRPLDEDDKLIFSRQQSFSERSRTLSLITSSDREDETGAAEPGRKKGFACKRCGIQLPGGLPSFPLRISKMSHCEIILIPRRHMPPIEQRPRLLLRISRQDNDSERRRRRGVSADRRKDLTMTNIAGFSPFVYLYYPCI